MNCASGIDARRTKLVDEDALREMLRRDVDWDAAECVKHGVVDEIVNEMVWRPE